MEHQLQVDIPIAVQIASIELLLNEISRDRNGMYDPEDIRDYLQQLKDQA